MRLVDKPLAGLALFELRSFQDERGFFMERFRQASFEEALGSYTFVQDNFSRSIPGVIRGLHYQVSPCAQAKLVSVTRGRILDVAVDIRKTSSTFGKVYSVELSEANGRVLFIGEGFAHGFCVLGTDAADVTYKTTTYYSGAHERAIRFDDPALSIAWPIEKPIVSEKDRTAPLFSSGEMAL